VGIDPEAADHMIEKRDRHACPAVGPSGSTSRSTAAMCSCRLAVEEPSVVAGALLYGQGWAARPGGGFSATTSEPLMIGQNAGAGMLST